MKVYSYNHLVGFEETNLVGNVYYANHIRWQGRCRELFILEHAPEILPLIESGELSLVTLSCQCDYFDELRAFDPVKMEMRLISLEAHTLTMGFDYFRSNGPEKQLVARGSQKIACMKKVDGSYVPEKFPNGLKEALVPYLAVSNL